MNFRPDLAEKVMRGEKTVTRRLVSQNPRSPWYIERCGLTVGCDYSVCPGRGKEQIGRVTVRSVERDHVGTLTDGEARREGFNDADEFEAAFTAINGARCFNPLAIVWRIEFEVCDAASG